MKIFSKRIANIVFACSVILMHACKDEEPVKPIVSTNLSKGVFVTNEGNFGTGTGTLAFIHRDGSGESHKVYQAANGNAQLGNIVQSMSIINQKAFIVVNNANKIVVADALSMAYVATIGNVNQPRYLVHDDSMIYVSCWDNRVKAYDLSDNQFVKSWTTSTGPEKLIWVDDELWVLNQGGLSVDSTVSIINPHNEDTETLNIYPRPTGIQVDKNGKVWIMCSGRLAYHPGGVSASHLICIDPVDRSIVRNIIFPWTEQHPANLEINRDGDELYYLYPGGISRISIDAEFPPPYPFINYSGTIYALGYDSIENMLYASDALDYVQNGRVYKYDVDDGSLMFSFSAGLIPGGFCFTDD